MSALGVLGFILLYKLGDSMATALATPFYLDMHFTKTDIGAVVKGSGLTMQTRCIRGERLDAKIRH